MLEEMDRADVRAGLLKKADLIPWVEENAAEKGWAPASLSWTAPPEADDPVSDRAEENEGDADDGAGAFEVTAEGEAALDDAA